MSTSTTIATWVPELTFGSRLFLLRRSLHKSVKEAAADTGLHYATWSTWENGRTPSNLAQVVSTIADTYGVDRNWLMWGQPSPDAHEGPLQPTDYTGWPFGMGWVPSFDLAA